ncbi:MAG: hypothetical protein JO065_11460, partial [Acidobacteria bacterium]|nr:hypothetical protein [Acidobacteriota bacterium]
MLKRWKNNKNSERGIALLVALFALVLITAVGLGMIFSSNSELSVNSSFRQNHLAFFAARSGLEEARDRMRYKSTDATNPAAMGIEDLLYDDSTTPPTPKLNPLGQAKSAIYIVNGNGIDPTNVNSALYFDDELCHEINNNVLVPNSPGSYNIKCPHNANSLPLVGGWATIKQAEAVPNNGGAISYAWTRINLKLQESTNPWCVLGFGICNPQAGPDAVADQVCYDGNREFVLSDALPLRDAPGGMGGVRPTEQLAAGMFFATTSGHGNSGHSSTTTSGTSTTGTSSTGTSSTGTSSTGTSGTGTTSTGTSSTGTSSTGTSSTGTSTTGTASVGTSTTGTSISGTASVGTTGTSVTGTASVGTSTTGTSSTGTSSTGTSSTGTSSTGTSSTGTSTSGSSTGGTTGGGSGSGGACSGVFTPTPPPATVVAPSCNSANGQPVYTLTTLAISPTKARRMLQYEIARIMVPPVPAALTMVGPNPNFGTPHSNNFGINGN